MKKVFLVSLFSLCFLLIASCARRQFNTAQLDANSNSAFRLPEQYEAQSACAKQDFLWKQILETKYPLDGLPNLNIPPGMASTEFSVANLLGYFDNLMNTIDLRVTLDRTSDIMPQTRLRVIHTYGTIAKVEFRPTEIGKRRYTGLFSSESSCGLARISTGTMPLLFDGYFPGLALKVFRDNKSSANFQLVSDLNGQGNNTDFFAQPLRNVLELNEVTKKKSMAFFFGKILKMGVTKYPYHLSNVDFSKFGFDGKEVERPRAPSVISFERGDYRPPEDGSDFRLELAALKPGKTLYKVFATSEDVKPYVEFVHIANVVVNSQFVASRFGDENIFFKHDEKVK